MVNLNGDENAGPFKNANSVETALNAAALQLEATLSGNGRDEAQTVEPAQNHFLTQHQSITPLSTKHRICHHTC